MIHLDEYYNFVLWDGTVFLIHLAADPNPGSIWVRALGSANGAQMERKYCQKKRKKKLYQRYFGDGNVLDTPFFLTQVEKSTFWDKWGLVTTVSMGYLSQICKIFTYRVFECFSTITAKRLTVATRIWLYGLTVMVSGIHSRIARPDR